MYLYDGILFHAILAGRDIKSVPEGHLYSPNLMFQQDIAGETVSLDITERSTVTRSPKGSPEECPEGIPKQVRVRLELKVEFLEVGELIPNSNPNPNRTPNPNPNL
jgi:hypothetical protein